MAPLVEEPPTRTLARSSVEFLITKAPDSSLTCYFSPSLHDLKIAASL